MERYGVDMCVIQPAFGMSNELDARIVEQHPDKFIAFCNDTETQRKAWRGEEKWTIKAACREIDGKPARRHVQGEQQSAVGCRYVGA